jgi:hypothetical protein
MCKTPREGLMQEIISMSAKELNRLKIIEKIVDKRLSLTKGAKLLDITPRHLRRLKKAYLAKGVSTLSSKKRGKTNHRHSIKLKDAVLSLIREFYSDYGPTLASEMLLKHHQINLSKETIRKWMDEAGIRKARSLMTTKVYQPRHRRSCLGELIQMDGSIHHWFEERGERCTLLVMIDDATGQLMQLRFAKAETTFDYFDIVKRHLKANGKPGAYYVDKHNVFRVNHAEALSGDGFTQFGRALETLGIKLIYANSPQAKGRVERVNRVLQDRLVKALRYHNISSIQEGNKFLKTFIIDFNKHFAKTPTSNQNAHVNLTPDELVSIEDLFTIHTTRKISKSLTISYNKSLFMIKEEKHPRRLIGQTVQINQYADGTIKLYHQNRLLEYKVMKKYDFQERVLGVREMHAFLSQHLTNDSMQRNKISSFVLHGNIDSGHF